MASIDFDPRMITELQRAQKIAVLTGAGVSAESGIPTFRDALTGLWRNFNAEMLATAEGFRRDPALVWGWYEWRRRAVLEAQPNAAHVAIAELGRRVPQLSLFTQNVDDLHERAGSSDVQHLHGSLLRPRCFDCGHAFPLPGGTPDEPEYGRRLPPPKCQECGGLIRPGVVWFNELLPANILDGAFESTSSCDLLIVVGTSGMVYPVAKLPEVARSAGRRVIQINSARSKLDHVCTWNVRGSAGKLFSEMISRAFG
jgi:NAD-dependent deacetylase